MPPRLSLDHFVYSGQNHRNVYLNRAFPPRPARFQPEAMTVLPNFSFARTKLLEQYNNQPKLAYRALKNTLPLVKQTLYNLFDESRSDDRFSEGTQRRIIDLIHPNLSMRFYSRINGIIKAENEEIDTLSSYVGKYKYFRKNNLGSFLAGAIRIDSENGCFTFKHWPEVKNADEAKGSPRHEGFVFIQGARIHLLGLGPRYIRPIVMHVCEDLSKEALHGFVITVSEKARGSVLFAARFVMVHESNPKYGEPKLDIGKILSDSSKIKGILVL